MPKAGLSAYGGEVNMTNRKRPQKLFYRPELKERRKQLRNNPTQAEKHLWQYINNYQIEGVKFRRQVSIGPYIVDFFCFEKRLAIEADGQHHFDVDYEEYEKEREKYLEEKGIKILRFENVEILHDTDRVLQEIEKHVSQ